MYYFHPLGQIECGYKFYGAVCHSYFHPMFVLLKAPEFLHNFGLQCTNNMIDILAIK